jgi:hypothetical protein
VLSLSDSVAELELCACTGEPVERVQLEDPAAIAQLARSA